MVNPINPSQVTKPLAPGRAWFDHGMTVLSYGLTALAILPLVSLVWKIFSEGLKQLSFNSLTQSLADEPVGFANAILGTLMIVLVSALFSLPTGIITAIYLSEFGKDIKVARIIRFMVRIISAVPSIVMGVFAYAVLVVTLGKPSALAGSFALAVLMLPMVILATEEALKLIPQNQRAGSAALGANQIQTTFKVVIRPALPGITTASLLAIARAAGETAPVLLTAQFSQFYPEGLLNPSPSLSVMIYEYAESPEIAQNELAWTASLVLLVLVMSLSAGARLLVKRSATR
ncbi:phosphate ABC transporter permease PstA [filamentous cyanobacterium LEGE 11480]|uniref:Phosphate transport system permease protein PstA n=1 Tax=Romeriopsis navalis LEGE 11480 TaxID=2777977 RepID=A0A928VP43_9CYAN|nr:phosphate ABC transporter permease PstA [Romeriopsis navalis]MBE9029549.1 phosphate ABC transporter permease PstA [Romeriopsis navalis LEGE 11480]